MPAPAASPPAVRLMFGAVKRSVGCSGQRRRHHAGIGRFDIIKQVHSVARCPGAESPFERLPVEPFHRSCYAITPAANSVNRKTHFLSLGEHVENSGAGEAEFLRKPFSGVETAVAQPTQDRKKLLVGSSMHGPILHPCAVASASCGGQ